MNNFFALLFCLIGSSATLALVNLYGYALMSHAEWWMVILAILASYNLGGLFCIISSVFYFLMAISTKKYESETTVSICFFIIFLFELSSLAVPWFITPSYDVLHVFACIATALTGVFTFGCILMSFKRK